MLQVAMDIRDTLNEIAATLRNATLRKRHARKEVTR
jgi:hypothetical protein